MNVLISNLILFIVFTNFFHASLNLSISKSGSEGNESSLIRRKRECSKCSNQTYDPKCYGAEYVVSAFFWNKCHMEEFSCSTKANFTEIEVNKCNFSYCQLPHAGMNQAGTVSCNCSNPDCSSSNLSEYCGLDGFFYWNECYVRKQACLSEKKFETSISTLACGNSKQCKDCRPTEVCAPSELGRIQCGCPVCSADIKSSEVCNETDFPFANECLLKKDACENKQYSYVAKECPKTYTEGIRTSSFNWNLVFEAKLSTELPKNISSYYVYIIPGALIAFLMVFIIIYSFVKPSEKKAPPPPTEKEMYRYAPKTQVLPIRMEDYHTQKETE